MASPMRMRGGGAAEVGRASAVVPSPKASATASLVAAGDGGFERLRLREGFFGDDTDLLAPVAALAAGTAAFCFFEFGIEALQDSRIDKRMVGQVQAVLKSEDDADKHVVVRGA
jgi:hypothetical protein